MGSWCSSYLCGSSRAGWALIQLGEIELNGSFCPLCTGQEKNQLLWQMSTEVSLWMYLASSQVAVTVGGQVPLSSWLGGPGGGLPSGCGVWRGYTVVLCKATARNLESKWTRARSPLFTKVLQNQQ